MSPIMVMLLVYSMAWVISFMVVFMMKGIFAGCCYAENRKKKEQEKIKPQLAPNH